MSKAVDEAIDKLAERFGTLDWTYYDVPGTAGEDKMWHWLGGDDEDVMMCVFRGREIHEQFHRQDFFFFNYAYKGSFSAVSQHQGNRITVGQGELVAGQPFTGYALDGSSDDEIVNAGVLVRKELFYRRLLPLVAVDRSMLHFFTDPEGNRFSNEFIHLPARRGYPYRELIRLMIVEYANGGEASQEILVSMVLTLTMYIVRQYALEFEPKPADSVSQQVEDYIAGHLGTATLQSAAAELGYHPNYVSSLVHKQTGETFSQMRTRLRMERAELLLERTELSVEDVAEMVGYLSTSNFYRAYRMQFGHSPRG
jgi:AraC-like DNA-binding protein